MIYVAIIGDMKASKELKERFGIQEQLKEVLMEVNDSFRETIAARFLITLGDEFQGLLKSANHVIEIIQLIQKKMYPVEIRFGIGIGEIRTKIDETAAIGADGPAFYAARDMVSYIHEQENKLKNKVPDLQLSVYEEQNFAIREINQMLQLLKVMENQWTEKQRITIWDMMEHGGNQESCAKRMNTTQSTVARRLQDGNYQIYLNTVEVINEAISRLFEEMDVAL